MTSPASENKNHSILHARTEPKGHHVEHCMVCPLPAFGHAPHHDLSIRLTPWTYLPSPHPP
eukprot:828926-Prymnesium_polylepis.1